MRDEMLEREVDDDTKHFNEDFSWCCRLPGIVADKTLRTVIRVASGTEPDFEKIKARRRVDPAMLHVLKFEKMSLGDRVDAAALAARHRRRQDREDARLKKRRESLLHCRDTLTAALAQLDDAIKTQNDAARALGAASVAVGVPA